MTVKLDSKIVGFQVVQGGEPAPVAPAVEAQAPQLEEMHEKMPRPEVLEGRTYKISNPNLNHALYVTINNAVLNAGTEHESRVPFEMFVNSKDVEHHQWVAATTLIVSAVFRKGGDCAFLVDQLKSVYDPKGGYMKRGGKFMPSLVAEIGYVLEQHLTDMGLIKKEVDPYQKAYLEQKRADFEASQAKKGAATGLNEAGYPIGAVLCDKCHTLAKVVMDGCPTCLSCGDSKCG